MKTYSAVPKLFYTQAYKAKQIGAFLQLFIVSMQKDKLNKKFWGKLIT
jgi:hypothetical protein